MSNPVETTVSELLRKDASFFTDKMVFGDFIYKWTKTLRRYTGYINVISDVDANYPWNYKGIFNDLGDMCLNVDAQKILVSELSGNHTDTNAQTIDIVFYPTTISKAKVWVGDPPTKLLGE